jgi:hypothetical protein
MTFLSTADIEAGLDHVRAAPRNEGRLDLIARRPDVGAREVVEVAELDGAEGLLGDSWRTRGSRHTPDGSAEVARQLTIMNSRAIDLFAAGDRARWASAGDQLYIDLDLSDQNLPPGTRLQLGDAVLEVSEEPHTGCAKFLQRFGRDVARFVNSPTGRELHLRGINARVVRPGTIRVGDIARKLAG